MTSTYHRTILTAVVILCVTAILLISEWREDRAETREAQATSADCECRQDEIDTLVRDILRRETDNGVSLR